MENKSEAINNPKHAQTYVYDNGSNSESSAVQLGHYVWDASGDGENCATMTQKGLKAGGFTGFDDFNNVWHPNTLDKKLKDLGYKNVTSEYEKYIKESIIVEWWNSLFNSDN